MKACISIFFFIFVQIGLFGQKINISHNDKIQGIIGGSFSENPGYIVSIHHGNNHIGAGVIVDPRTIVTAAHVVDNFAQFCGGCLTIRAGSDLYNSSTQAVKSESIILHGLFGGFQNIPSVYDIAIVKIDEPFTFDENVRPIEITKSCLFSSEGIDFGTSCKIYGWGRVDPSNLSLSPSRIKSSLGTIFNLAQSPFWTSEPRYPTYYNINSMFATYSPNGQAYFGDSGGPCVITRNGKEYLAGIISWGQDPNDGSNPNITYPDVMADVFKTRDFIIENMEPGYSCDIDGPVLLQSSLNLECDGLVNINDLFEGQIPAGHELRWSKDPNPFDCIDSYSTGTISEPGTYYGYFYNIAFDCYGNPSEPISVIPVCMSTDNLTITSNLTLLAPQVFNKIEVMNGAVLTIGNNVEVKILDKIIVGNGSKLVIDGGHLTNCQHCPMWNGIQLAGHLSIGLNTFNPGKIELTNGGIISNAKVGIETKNIFNFPYYGYGIEYGGGIINMSDNALIFNCEIGIRFGPHGWGSFAGYGTPDEQSSISSSRIESCTTGVFLENNIGLEINNSTFVDNTTDIIAYRSSYDLGNSTLNSGIEHNAEYPSLVGGNLFNNTFIEANIRVNSQGNIIPYALRGNSNFGSGLFIFGDLDFSVVNNDFFDSEIGIAAWQSGHNQYNLVTSNGFYNNEYGSSTYGSNDIEYLSNCFENTDQYDIELYSNASIHQSQGDPFEKKSAGNCFDYYARIGTGLGSLHFDYWTKDGYTPSANCKFPGQGNFSLQLAENELTANCGSGNVFTNLPRQYRDCECEYGDKGCRETINALNNEIALLEVNNTMNPWIKKWFLAKYRRCLDRLKKTFIRNLLKDGKKQEAIEFSSIDTSFRYQIIAYAIMMNEAEYSRAQTYLLGLDQGDEMITDFTFVQSLYHSYLQNRSGFSLSIGDRNALLIMCTKENPYSGYARSVYYLLTGEKVKIDLPHIDGNVSFQRGKMDDGLEEISIYPNPLYEKNLEIEVQVRDHNDSYEYDIISSIGKMVQKGNILSSKTSLIMDISSGFYLVRIFKNGKLIRTEKLIKV